MQTESGPPFLHGASVDLAAAYVKAAHEAKVSGRAARSVRVDGYSLTVGVRRLEDEEKHSARYLWGAADFQIVTRVDVLGAARTGLEADPQKIDLWVARQEAGLDCLFWDWNGFKAPFPADLWSLSLDETMNPESSWASHIVEKGRFRLSVWTVGPPFDALLGRKRTKR